jgi:hypothetical protein
MKHVNTLHCAPNNSEPLSKVRTRGRAIECLEQFLLNLDLKESNLILVSYLPKRQLNSLKSIVVNFQREAAPLCVQ